MSVHEMPMQPYLYHSSDHQHSMASNMYDYCMPNHETMAAAAWKQVMMEDQKLS